MGDGSRASGAVRQKRVELEKPDPSAAGFHRRALCRAHGGVRSGNPFLLDRAGCRWMVATHLGELHRALRIAPSQAAERPLRALPPGAFLELQSPHLQSCAAASAAPFGSSRPSDAALSIVAELRRAAATPCWLSRDVHDRARATALAPRHGSPAA